MHRKSFEYFVRLNRNVIQILQTIHYKSNSSKVWEKKKPSDYSRATLDTVIFCPLLYL